MPRSDCKLCKGLEKVQAHIQPTDRGQPCFWDWRPCPLCAPDINREEQDRQNAENQQSNLKPFRDL